MVLRPVLGPVDGRVADINRRVTHAQDAVLDVDRHIGAVEAALAAYADDAESYRRAANEMATYIGRELRRFDEGLQGGFGLLRDASQELDQSVGEVQRSVGEVQRSVGEVQGSVGEVVSLVKELKQKSTRELFSDRLGCAVRQPLDALEAPLAEALNYAGSHRGFVAQAGLWFNPPVVVELSEGAARPTVVNERIVEIPFAMGELATLEPGARIIDIGAAESTFALSAASLGYRVTAIDLRSMPDFKHPNLELVIQRFEDWQAPVDGFDAAFLISTIEHVGLGAYGEAHYGEDSVGAGADRALVDCLGNRLAKHGKLILTVPYGDASIGDLERSYDDAGLDRLLDGWRILKRRICVQLGQLQWLPADGHQEGRRGVAMIVADRP